MAEGSAHDFTSGVASSPSTLRRGNTSEHREGCHDPLRCILTVILDNEFGGDEERRRLGETAHHHPSVTHTPPQSRPWPESSREPERVDLGVTFAAEVEAGLDRGWPLCHAFRTGGRRRGSGDLRFQLGHEPTIDPTPHHFGVLGGSIRSMVFTRSIDLSNDATLLTPVLSAHATR